MAQLIFSLIPKIMAEVGSIGKDRKNSQQGYAYRGVDDAYAALQLILAKHGVFTVPEVLRDETEERQTKSGSNLIYRKLLIKYTFYASDGSSFSAVVLGEGMDSGDKASNKAMSVAHKYALLQVFMIPTQDAKDPEIDSHEVVQKPTKVAAKKASGYNPDNYDHQNWLMGELAKSTVSKGLWTEIQNKLTGRPSTDLPQILKEYQNA